jgi:RNA polymerase sigma factor (sigma-70 family)
MQAKSDAQLLRDYTERGTDTAFRELVARHTSFVYSSALRQVAASAVAADLTQGVFVDLARKAGSVSQSLLPEASLAGWLHRSTRYAALNHLRDTRRRREHERQAMEQLLTNSESAADWEQIRPALDEALDQLGDEDREALLLRYFKNQDLRTVGLALGVSDDAAQKRVSRAVERLREFFAKRGVTIGAGGLVVLITANAVQAAPVGLALTIANTSLAAAGTTLTFMKIATATKLKLAFSAIVVAGAVTALIIQPQSLAKMQGENILLRQQITHLQADNSSLSNRIAEIGEVKKLSAAQFTELLKLRGEVGVLRRQIDESAQVNRKLQNVKVQMRNLNSNSPEPQLHIKARFIAMPKGASYDLKMVGVQTSNKAIPSHVFNDESFRSILHELQSHDDVETLAEPEVTTTTGRQTQMRVTEIIDVVTKFALQESNNVSSIVPQTEPLETGSILDVIPKVLSDGYTIELSVIPSVIDFLGYAPSTAPTPAYTANGQEIDVPTVSPQFQVQQATNTVNLLDGQTMVLTLNNNIVPIDPGAALLKPDGTATKYLAKKTLVFITANIVDPAGNVVHTNAGNYSDNIPTTSGQ